MFQGSFPGLFRDASAPFRPKLHHQPNTDFPTLLFSKPPATLGLIYCQFTKFLEVWGELHPQQELQQCLLLLGTTKPLWELQVPDPALVEQTQHLPGQEGLQLLESERSRAFVPVCVPVPALSLPVGIDAF